MPTLVDSLSRRMPDQNNTISFSNMIELVRSWNDYSSTSLTQYAKHSMVASRVFIQQNILNETVLPDLLMNLQNMYVGYILTAVQMNTRVDGCRRIRDMLDIVATESLSKDDPDSCKTIYRSPDTFIGMEESANKFFKQSSPNMFVELPTNIVNYQQDAKFLDNKTNAAFPSGRIVEISFMAGPDPDKSKNKLAIHIFVQLLPTLMSDSVAGQFLAANFTPRMLQRWVQWRTGEIAFWKDFVFQRDLLSNRRKALKDDKSGVLYDMFERQQNALSNALLKFALITPEKQNIANTILIFNKDSFDKFCHDNNCNFSRPDHRNKFFHKTFAMIVAVVDPMYGQVELYFHGINSKGQYNYKQMSENAKTEKYDLKDIMAAYSQGNAPRF